MIESRTRIQNINLIWFLNLINIQGEVENWSIVMEVGPEITTRENKIFKVENENKIEIEFDAKLQLKILIWWNPFEIKVFFV